MERAVGLTCGQDGTSLESGGGWPFRESDGAEGFVRLPSIVTEDW